MAAKREYRDRDEVELGVLDALVDRADEGMTVFEVRAAVDADIDHIEEALRDLKDEGLIRVESPDGGNVVLYPADRVVPDADEAPRDEDPSLIDHIRRRLGL